MPTAEKTETYHHGNLRTALIAAALSLIMDKGMDAVTIREVASKAGVSHTAPYRHFTDKSALMAAVAKEGFDLMVAQMRQRMAAHPDDPLLQFKYCGIGYIEFALAHPAHYRVMFGPCKDKSRASEELKKSAATSFQTLLNAIAACQAQGLVHDGDLMAMALAAWSMVHGFSMLLIEQLLQETSTFQQKLPAMVDVVVDSLYSGLRPKEKK